MRAKKKRPKLRNRNNRDLLLRQSFSVWNRLRKRRESARKMMLLMVWSRKSDRLAKSILTR